MLALAIISHMSFQLARTKPAFPRAFTYFSRFTGSLTMLSHASTGFELLSRSSFHNSYKSLRTYGYFTLTGLYVYQEKLAPRGHPRGSYSGKSSPVLG